MVINMYRISWVKGKEDKCFKTFKALGFDVFEVDDLENVDKQLQKLKKENYNTIVISNLVASYSKDIITKYKNDSNINIIIAPLKE